MRAIRKSLRLVLLILAVAGSGSRAGADGFKADVSLGAGMLTGDTTYRIGGVIVDPLGTYEDIFPISELAFPCDVFVASAAVGLEFAGNWESRLTLTRNITGDAGTARNSDWGFNYRTLWWWMDERSLDIYSESDADLDLLEIDACIRYWFYKSREWSLGAGLGYRHQDFDWDVSNLDQWYPSLESKGLDLGHDIVSGKAGTYTVTYGIPYVEALTRILIADPLSIRVSLGYSPFVRAKDEDQHLLRDPPITAKGDCEGYAVLLKLAARYEFPRDWFVTAELSYADIFADGTQENFIDGEWVWTTDEEIESEQTAGSVAVGRAF